MFKPYWMEIYIWFITLTVAILTGCFTRTSFLLRESTSIMSGNGKGFTFEELFRSPFTELDQVFLSIQLKTFSKFSGWTFKFFAFELYYSLFHILMIKSKYLADRALFNFLFNLLKFSNKIIAHNWFWS